ncbi:DUF6249 domain-containing protein [Reichenbachiella sp. MALMAid0571]|uniref:DUF6249 domain-containing protein n=1 Tax=Reichenbachiella sp. MALMAid0571 TaxID=3143939 RepID=UPI0032DFA1BB
MNTIDPLLFVTVLLVLLFVFIFLTWYFSHKAKTKERLLLIDKGIDIEKFLLNDKPSNIFLKFAIIVIGLAVAFAIQALMLRFEVEDEPPYLAVLFLCGGISLLIVHLINRVKR